MSSVLIDSIHLCNFGANGLALQYGFLFAFRKQRNFIIHVFQNNKDKSLTRQLLDPVILKNEENNVIREEFFIKSKVLNLRYYASTGYGNNGGWGKARPCLTSGMSFSSDNI